MREREKVVEFLKKKERTKESEERKKKRKEEEREKRKKERRRTRHNSSIDTQTNFSMGQASSAPLLFTVPLPSMLAHWSIRDDQGSVGFL